MSPIVSGGGGGGSVTAAAIEATFTAAGQQYLGTGSGTGALLAPAAGVLVLTTGDVSTSSASFVDATGITVTITTGAHRCRVGFVGVANVTSAAAEACIDLAIDGTRQGGTLGLVHQSGPNVSGYNEDMSFTYLTAVLTAAAHTFKIQYKTSGGTVGLYASASSPAVLWVEETLLLS